MFRRIWLGVRSILLRGRLEREMRAEMAEHIERSTQRLMTRGMSEEEARRQATREFGNVASIQEGARDARGGRWVETLAADARFALRQYRRNTGTTVTMLVVLIGGMTISTSLFSFLHSYSVQPPPGIEWSENLVRIRGAEVSQYGAGIRRFTRDELEAYESLTDYFRSVAAWADHQVMIDLPGQVDSQPLWASGTFVSRDYFQVLDVPVAAGRSMGAPASSGFQEHDLVAVISHSLWDRLYGRSPSALGSSLTVNGAPVTVIGIAPRRFKGVTMLTEFKVWLPMSARALLVPGFDPNAESFAAAARLAPGITAEKATPAVASVADAVALETERPYGAEAVADVVPLIVASGDPNFDRDVTMMTVAFVVFALLVLLVTCTNVSALQTGLGMARRQEIAIRLSMGAARSRVLRQLLTESILLAGIAAAMTLAVVAGLQKLAATQLPDIPFTVEVSWQAAAFTFVIALAAGVAFGLSPALHATRFGVASALKDSSSGIAAPRGRLQRGLVVTQVAFTQPLVVGLSAMLLVLLGGFQNQMLNSSSDQILSLTLRPGIAAPIAAAGGDGEAREGLANDLRILRERLAGTAGVAHVAGDPGTRVALRDYSVHPEDRVPGSPEEGRDFSAPVVTPGYFEVMGYPVIVGRDFEANDLRFASEGARTALPVVIDSDLARVLWPGASPIGRRLRAGSNADAGSRLLSVVGVVNAPQAEERTAAADYQIFLPPDSTQARTMSLLLRTQGDAAALIPQIRAITRNEAPRLAIFDLRTLRQQEEATRRAFVIGTAALASAGLVALLLSAIGLYAVVSFSVRQRKAEIAVRMAVGANARHVMAKFLRDGLRLSIVGLAIGLPLSLLALRGLLSMPDFLPTVPLPRVALITAAAVAAVAVAATLIPARRAAAVEPAMILREE